MREERLKDDRVLDRFFPWHGERDLKVVFWFYGVGVSFVLAGVMAGALQSGAYGLLQASMPIAALYTLWILTAIWRCTEGCQEFWSILARWLTVAWAINAAMVLAFLQVELATG